MQQYIIPGLIIAVAAFFGGFGILAQPAEVVVYFETVPKTEKEAEYISVRVDASKAVNVVGGTISYPFDVVEFEVQKSVSPVVNVWITEPSISKPGEISFAGGTNDRDGLLKDAELFRITVASTTGAEAVVSFSKLEAFASDGQGTRLRTAGDEYTVNAKTPTQVIAGGSGVAPHVVATRSDFNDDGVVDLADVSILMVKMLSPYEEKFDINADRRVAVEDLSIMLTALGKYAEEVVTPAP
jgi:hypothetical protein